MNVRRWAPDVALGGGTIDEIPEDTNCLVNSEGDVLPCSDPSPNHNQQCSSISLESGMGASPSNTVASRTKEAPVSERKVSSVNSSNMSKPSGYDMRVLFLFCVGLVMLFTGIKFADQFKLLISTPSHHIAQPIKNMEWCRTDIQARRSDEYLPDSYEETSIHVLSSTYMDIELGIAEAKQSGYPEQAVTALEEDFAKVKSKLQSGVGFDRHTTPALHVVYDSSEDASTVVVTDTAPIVLMLISNGGVAKEWTVTVKPGAKVERVYLVDFLDPKCSDAHSPNGVTVNGIAPDKLTVKHISKSASLSRATDWFSDAKKLSGFDICTFQHRSEGWAQAEETPPDPWVVGKESLNWRIQMTLKEIQPLHARAMAPVREKIFKWFSGNKVCATLLRTLESKMVYGELVPPSKPFDYIPQVSVEWGIADDQVFKLKVLREFGLQGQCTPKLAQSSDNELFGISASGVTKLSSDKIVVMPPPRDFIFEPIGNDISFDSKRKRLLVTDLTTLCGVDPATGKWSGISFLVRDKRDHEFVLADTSAMTYYPPDDSLFFLEGSAGFSSSWLTKYSLEGVPTARKCLSHKIPAGDSLNGKTTMFYANPFLLAISSAPDECPRSWKGFRQASDFEGRSYSAQVFRSCDPRPYLWVIEPNSGRVLLCAPLEVERRN